MRKVLVLDTSILCVWLEVPGFTNCGPDHDRWDRDRVAAKIEAEQGAKTTFVLPLATLIETGNHIAQAAHSRMERSAALAELMIKSANSDTPWAAFSDQSRLWSPENLRQLAVTWPILAQRKMSLGDATIKDVADYYAQVGWQVEILTGDTGLKAFQPHAPIQQPRRRQGR